MTISRSNPRAKQRWGVLAFVVAALTLALAASSLAVHDNGKFELDRNATNDLNVTLFGTLGANVSGAATATTIPICRTADQPTTPFTILVEAERMSVTGEAGGSFGGNCAGTKVNYTVTRGIDGTTRVAHSKSGVNGNVSLVVPDPGKPGPDWNQVHAAIQADANSNCSTLGLVECSFISDQIGPTTFIGGASKDHLDIPGWQHTSGASPDKAEILNAYAAKAIVPASGTTPAQQILYFGMDRYAVDGSTDIGFWFFKNPVVACPTTPASAACEGVADGSFVGEHAIGDILALGTFTQGGATTNIRIFTWVGTGGNESGTIDGPAADLGDCNPPPPIPSPTNDRGCATVNNTTIEVPSDWLYTFKGSSSSGWIPAGGFYEGGVNLTALNLDGCFSSFLAETRSSPEITAILKDFTLGSFEACETALTTTPANGSGTALADSNDPNDVSALPDIKIGTGASGVPVTDTAQVTVNGLTTWTGTVSFFLCGPLSYTPVGDPPAAPLCTTGGVAAGTKNVSNATTTATSDQLKLTSVGRYCWRGVFTPSEESASDGLRPATDARASECFEVIPVTPTLTTTAWSTGDDAGSAQTTPVDFGDPLFDRADLSGTANDPATNGASATYPSILGPAVASNGAAANGTITFTLVGPDGATTDCTTEATSDDVTQGNPEDVTVSGDGDYYTSGFTPDAPGDYHWKASYDGDSPNTLGTSHNDECDETGEDVTVRQIPTAISTDQWVYPNDDATVSSSDSSVNLPGGTVTFRLYAATPASNGTPAKTALENCQAHGTTLGSGGLIYVEQETVDGVAASETESTSNTTVKVESDATVYWWVTYDPADSAFTGRQSDCVENTVVDFTDHAGPGTVFTPSP